MVITTWCEEGEGDNGPVLLHANGVFSRNCGEDLPDARHGMAARFGEGSKSSLSSLIGVGGEEQFKVLSAGDAQCKPLLLPDWQQREAGGERDSGVVQQRRDPTLLAEMAKILEEPVAEIDHGVGESMASQRLTEGDPGERPEMGGDRLIDESRLQ
jgi:hypothetical protein